MASDMELIFKALADPGRRKLLDRLFARNGQTLGELCESQKVSRQAVTKQLKLLEAANLVVPQWRGREKLHYLNPLPILEIADRWIGKYERGRIRVLAELKQRLEGKPTMAESRFVYVTYIRTTPQQLWEALTQPEFTRKYWVGTWQDCDWQVGSGWKLMIPDGRIGDQGQVLEIDPPRKLVLAWANVFMPELAAEGDSRLTYELEPVGESVKLTVTHEMDRPNSKLIGATSQGWPHLLASLKSLLETGESLAETRNWPQGI